MQFIFFYIISLSCLSSLVISAPIDQGKTNLQETKHEKASAAANHLLKELADEQIQSDTSDEENDDIESIPIIEYFDDSSSETIDFDDLLPAYELDLMTDLDEESECMFA